MQKPILWGRQVEAFREILLCKILDMLIKQFKEIGVIFLVSSLSWFVWNIIPTTLNDEFFNLDYEFRNPFLRGEYKIRIISFLELIKYLILSLLLSVSIIFPFWHKKEFEPKLQYSTAFFIITTGCFVGCYFLDQTAKGALLVNWLGDDFPYGWRLILFHILSPVVLFFLIRKSLAKIGKISLFFFFVFGLLATIICYEIFDGRYLNIGSFRKVVSSGYYNFFITLLLGLYFSIVSKFIDVGNDKLDISHTKKRNS